MVRHIFEVQVPQNIGANVGVSHKKLLNRRKKQPVIMVEGSESGFCVRAQTIIIHNYCSNYFNIIAV